MTHLQFYSYAEHGKSAQKDYNMSQTVRIPLSGEIITISGQGGWDRATSEVADDPEEEMNKAFDNVHHALIDAGGKGMEQVYKIVIYYAPISPEALEFSGKNFKKWFPNHSPIFTALGIEKLALDKMRVEIEAWAHVP